MHQETFYWDYGPNLPFPLELMASVQWGNTVALIGGSSFDEYSDVVLIFDHEAEEWLMGEDKLRVPRLRHTAVLVDQSIFPECE